MLWIAIEPVDVPYSFHMAALSVSPPCQQLMYVHFRKYSVTASKWSRIFASVRLLLTPSSVAID